MHIQVPSFISRLALGEFSTLACELHKCLDSLGHDACSEQFGSDYVSVVSWFPFPHVLAGLVSDYLCTVTVSHVMQA